MFKVNREKAIRDRAVIKVIGVGGGGGNAVSNMARMGIANVEFIAANTDAQALQSVQATKKVKLGEECTKSLGAGADPNVGARAADESKAQLAEAIEGADLLFITAGMGGGTGTGASPVIAKIAKDMGISTIAVVTKPFEHEGDDRMRVAIEGIAALKPNVDCIIVIPNEKLVEISTQGEDDDIFIDDAFKMADDVLRQGVQGISDIVNIGGRINLDFADLHRIMEMKGSAHFGIGSSSIERQKQGQSRALAAAEAAINSPLLETSIDGATGLLVNIIGPKNLGVNESKVAVDMIKKRINPNAKLIYGTGIDENTDKVVVTVIATGLGGSVPTEQSNPRTDFTQSHEKYDEVQPEPEKQASTGKRQPEPSSKPERTRPAHSSSELNLPSFLRKK